MFLLAVVTWPSAPERIPVHWNLAGQVDRYAAPLEALLGLPVVALAVYVLLLFAPRVDPKRANYAGFAGAYAIVRLCALAILALVYRLIHLWLRGIAVDPSTVLPFACGILFLVLGAVMPRLEPNWLVGIRTPWTLASARFPTPPGVPITDAPDAYLRGAVMRQLTQHEHTASRLAVAHEH